MSDSLRELKEFQKEQFSNAQPTVYVPPSNILSKEGREVVADTDGIRAIASVYTQGTGAYSHAYAQEFTVSPDGIVEVPRITSGEFISADDLFLAYSELNMHYVNSHFIHPDDILDASRGADAGWEQMRDSLDSYMTWVDETAPDISHLTASGMVGAVQRYASVTPHMTTKTSEIDIELDGFQDYASFFVRFNDVKPGQVSGGSLTQLNDSLYLLQASSASITIQTEAK